MTRAEIEAADGVRALSVASAWEMAIKSSLGTSIGGGHWGSPAPALTASNAKNESPRFPTLPIGGAPNTDCSDSMDERQLLLIEALHFKKIIARRKPVTGLRRTA